MENLDEDICEFFFAVTKRHLTYLTHPETVKLVKKVLTEIRRRCKGSRPKRERNLHRKFHSLGNVAVASRLEDAAHSYEFNTCLTSSTAKCFSEVMEANAEFFGRKVSRKSVGICCIADCMASEMVAIVETLCRNTGSNCDMQDFLHFQLAFVDADDRWRSVAESVVRQLGEVAKSKHRVKLTPRFVRSQDRGEVLEVLRSSDVLVSTKFSAQLSDLRVRQFLQLLEEALQHMKPDSLLLMIDSSVASTINCLERDINKFGRFEIVHSKTYGNHCLNLDSTRHHLKLYSDYFGVDLSRSYCFFSARAWLKSENRKDSLKDRVQTPLKVNCGRKTARKTE